MSTLAERSDAGIFMLDSYAETMPREALWVLIHAARLMRSTLISFSFFMACARS
jgi:hypothetical protein